jgi:hypothetical protein
MKNIGKNISSYCKSGEGWAALDYDTQGVSHGGVLALVGTVITNLQLLAFVSPFFALKSKTTPLPFGPQSK